MKQFKRKNKKSFVPDIAPLIDVMFMLLLFFLLTSSFVNPSIALKMPQASNKQKVNKEQLIVSVTKESTIYLNNKQCLHEELESLLKEEIKGTRSRKVVFRGDQDISYKTFISVMDIIKRAGVKEINIAHESRSL